MSEMPRLRYDLHDEIENKHWWFLARRGIIVNLLRRFLPWNTGKTVLEVGCGTGGNLLELKKYYTAFGTEISIGAAEIARNKTGCPVFLGDNLDALGKRAGTIDAVLLLDLLEHLENPVGFLRGIGDSIRDGTLILITVPAGQWFFSEHDFAFGHLRRYSRLTLMKELGEAGFGVAFISYFNAILFPLAVAVRLLRKVFLPLRKGAQYKTDFWMPLRPLNSLLKGMMASESLLLGKHSIPFGLSLIAVAINKRGGSE